MGLKFKRKIGVSGAESFGAVHSFAYFFANEITKGLNCGRCYRIDEKRVCLTADFKTGNKSVNADPCAHRKQKRPLAAAKNTCERSALDPCKSEIAKITRYGYRYLRIGVPVICRFVEFLCAKLYLFV